MTEDNKTDVEDQLTYLKGICEFQKDLINSLQETCKSQENSIRELQLKLNEVSKQYTDLFLKNYMSFESEKSK